MAEAAAAFEALLRDRSAAPDLRAYNALVDALARNGDMAAAERMLGAACDWAAKQGGWRQGGGRRGGQAGADCGQACARGLARSPTAVHPGAMWRGAGLV